MIIYSVIAISWHNRNGIKQLNSIMNCKLQLSWKIEIYFETDDTDCGKNPSITKLLIGELGLKFKSF